MKSLKIISLLLAALMCLPLLAACADNGPQVGGTRPVGNGQSDVGNFIDADYKGEDFTFLHLRQLAGTKDYYGGKFLDSETYAGLTLEDAVYDRNVAVEEKYKVNIVERIEDGEEPLSFLQTAAFSDDYTYDVIYGWGYKMGTCVIEGLFADINSLPNVDLTQEYWSPSSMEDLMINDKLYITINDISMNKLEWGSLIFFNKQIVEDYNVTKDMDGKTFYELVNEGKWTIDKFLQAVQLISTDVDGNGTIDKTDVYGLIDGDASGSSFGYSCGITLTTTADDGSYLVSYYNDNNYALATKIHDVLSNKKFVKDYVNDLGANADVPDGMEIHEYYRSFFSNGHALFSTGTAQITGEFRDMEDEYGVIPFPKLDENQQNYISTIDSNAALFAIPATYNKAATTAGADRTGAILEYMSYKSNQVVLPAYYETLLKGQRLNSEDDQVMLDIVRENIHYVFAAMMGDSLTDIKTNYEAMCSSPSSAASTFRAKSKVMQAALDDFYMDMLAVEDKLAGK